MEETVYKVVKKMHGELISVTNPACKCFYEIGKKTIPTIGGVFVFRSLEDAEVYQGMYLKELAILSGIGFNVRRIRKICGWAPDYYRFWTLKKHHKSTEHISCCGLPNSFVCDWFIPMTKHDISDKIE